MCKHHRRRQPRYGRHRPCASAVTDVGLPDRRPGRRRVSHQLLRPARLGGVDAAHGLRPVGGGRASATWVGSAWWGRRWPPATPSSSNASIRSRTRSPSAAACSTNPADGKRCAADGLCVASADFPSLPFCSALCRNDADCPSDASGPARCIEHDTPKLPNGSVAHVGLCTPMSKIAGTACVRERDCAANEGCVGVRRAHEPCASAGRPAERSRWARSARGTPTAAAPSVSTGTSTSTADSAPTAPRAATSTATAARISTARDWWWGTTEPPTTLSTTCCRAIARRSSPSASGACGADGDCLARGDGSDTCDTAHGICYRAAALPGAACTADAQCPLGGTCSKGPRFVGGYCQTFGCSPTATSGADALPRQQERLRPARGP